MCVCVGDASKWPTRNTRDISVSADKLRDGQRARLQTGFTGTCFSVINNKAHSHNALRIM